MATHPNRPQDKSSCPECGKQIVAAGRAGSLTSYLFQPFNCNCASKLAGQSAKGASSSDAFCAKCGLQKVAGSQGGSITGFLFQDTRCKCLPERLKRFSQTAIDLQPGAVIGGHYRLRQLIGRGAMGEVYLAEHVALGKTFALKLIPPDLVTDGSWQRFQKEARAISGLEHINLVKVSDLGLHEGCLPYYAMDYVEGEILEDKLGTFGPMPLNMVLEIFIQVCDGLDCAHRAGVVHRDLKPGNIMLVKVPGGKVLVKIVDFGLVKLTQDDRNKQSLTAVGTVFGSPFYMSPEQCVGGKIDNRSDIYSVGCTMFECLTGGPPFDGDSPVEIVTHHQATDAPSLESVVGPRIFPQSMEVVLAKLLRKNPVERYQTLLELRSDLEKVARSEEVQPFYVSRSRPASFAVDSRANSGAAANRSFFSGRKIIFIAAAFTLMVGSVSVVLLKGKGPAVSSSAPISAPAVPSISGSQTALTPFSSIITKTDGQRYILFKFPAKESLGSIEIDNSENHYLVCQGDVAVPLGHSLHLLAGPACLRNTEYLDRLRPNDFEALTLGSLDMESSEEKLTGATLEHITHLKGLRFLSVYFAYAIDDSALASLEKMSGLQGLKLDETNISPPALARSNLIHRLNELNMSTDKSVTTVLERLQGTSTMQRLLFSGAPFKHSDYQLLATMKNLVSLETSGCNTSDEDLAEISGLKRLQHLDLGNSLIDIKALPILQKMQAQGLQSILLTSTRLQQKDMERLKKECAGLIFCEKTN